MQYKCDSSLSQAAPLILINNNQLIQRNIRYLHCLATHYISAYFKYCNQQYCVATRTTPTKTLQLALHAIDVINEQTPCSMHTDSLDSESEASCVSALPDPGIYLSAWPDPDLTKGVKLDALFEIRPNFCSILLQASTGSPAGSCMLLA